MLNKLYSYFFNKANNLRSQISKKEGEAPWRVRIFSVLELFFLELMEDVFKLFILLFKNPYDSFQLFTKQETLPICEYSYTDHRRFQKKVRLFSLAGLSSVISATIIINLILSLVIPGQIPSYAKTVNGGWDDWSLTNLAGDPPVGSAGSIAISPAESVEISGTGNASTLALKPFSYTATDDGIFSTTGSSTRRWGETGNKLLLQADGTDTSTTFTDETGKTVTAYGDAQIDTALSKFGGASAKFDGTGDYLSIPSSTDLDAGAGAFTIDFWVYMNNQTGNQLLYSRSANELGSPETEDDYYALYGGSLKIGGGDNVEWNTGLTFSAGAWHHIEIGWDGVRTEYAFVDGVGTSNVTTLYRSGAGAAFRIANSLNVNFFNGSIDEFRFSNFTLPGAFSKTGNATRIWGETETKLLLQADGADTSNVFTDETGKAVIAYGDAQIDTALSKFGGASAKFDGTGDYLSIPSSTDLDAGAGAFTIDFWVYMNNQTGNQLLYSRSANDVGNPGAEDDYYAYYGGSLKVGGGDNTEWNTGLTFSAGAWHHIEIGWNGVDTEYTFVDGVGASNATSIYRSGAGAAFRIAHVMNINYFNGSIDNFRFSKGILRHSANFTPPTSAYVTGTFSNTAVTGSGAGASVGLASSGLLTALSPATVATEGAPYGIGISADGAFVYVPNYNSNTVSMYSRNTSTGFLTALSPATIATGGAPWDIVISADGTSAYVVNHTASSISMYSRNTSTGLLTALSPATIVTGGSYPRNITISADGASVYVPNQSSNTVSMFSRNTSTGLLTALSPATIATGTTPIGVDISPDGAFVYVPSVNSDAVSMYSRNTSTGLLTALSPATIAAGDAPWDIAISADGASAYVSNYISNTVSMYSRNTSTGLLTALSPASIAAESAPYGITISADGASVYVVNATSNTISMYSRNPSTGLLTALSPATIATGSASYGIDISPDGASVYAPSVNNNTVSMYSRSTISSGTFESATIDLGGKGSLGNLDWTATTPSQTSVWSQTSDGDFSGTNSSTVVSSGSVGLAVDTNNIVYSQKTIAVSSDHIVGIKNDGTVVASGNNTYGELNVSDWTDIKDISADAEHTVGLKSNGTVVGTGRNDDGELNVSGWTDIKDISSGILYTVGLKNDGTLIGAGFCSYYGMCTISSSWTGLKAVEINGSGTRIIGLKNDGTVVCAGDGCSNYTAFTNIKAISGNLGLVVGIKNDGSVVCGDNPAWCNFSGNIIKYAIAGYGDTAFGLKDDGNVLCKTLIGAYCPDLTGWENQDIKAISGTFSVGLSGLKSDGSVLSTGNPVFDTTSFVNIKQPTYGYSSSGTYTSSIKQIPNIGFGAMSWVASVGSGQSVTMKVRSCNDSACSGEPSFASLSAVTNGQDISTITGVTDGHSYIQYQASFVTSDTIATPTLDSVSISITTPLALQVATSDSSSGPWTYYGSDGAPGTYFTSSGTAIPSALSGKRYFRYKAYLSTANTAYTPTLDSLTLNYTQYISSSSISNLIFNTGYPNIGWATVSWVRSDANTASSTIKAKIQARVAATDTALASATFVGYNNANTNSSTYFDKSGANCSEADGKWGDTAGDNAAKKTVTCYIDGADATYLNPTATSNQWLELKLILEGDIANTPIVDAVRATYSINNEPQICAKLDLATDPTGQTCDNTITTLRQADNSEVVQSQSPTTYGRVIFNTYLRDPDTDASSVELNKGKMLIALEYSDASGVFSQAAPPSGNAAYYDAGNFATAANLTLTPNESGFSACEASGRTDAFKYLCSIYRDDTGTSGTNEANKYSGYSVNWNAKGDVPSAYTLTRKVRVIAYDQEGANSVTAATPATSVNFIFDTTNPTGSAVASAKDGSLTLSVSDEGLVYYKLSHDNVTWTPADETSWTGPVSGASNWTYQEQGDRTSKVYYRLRDAYGNVKAVASVSTPQRPTNIMLQDVSNVKALPASYKNFLSWEVVATPLSGAGFAKYDVYRCTPTEADPSCAESTNYILINAGQNTSISDNSYTDDNVVANNMYYYHIAAKDNAGNISKWSDQDAANNPLYGKANGTQDFGEGGGGGDAVPPIISVFSITDKAQTSAKVIWTTGELASGGVFYSTDTSYNSERSTLSYQTSGYDSVNAPSGRAINVVGLDANKTYNIKLKSVDASGNTTICDGSSPATTTADALGKFTAVNNPTYCPSGATYSFATLEKDVTPPVISSITISPTEVTHNSAKVSWSTNENSDSCVGYDSAEIDRTYKTEQCDSTQTQSHSITLGGLSPTTTYYIKLKSRDTSDNLASNCSTESKTDCPSESNFSFLTVLTPVPTVSVSGGGGGGKTDFSAPDISNIKVSDITKDSATITWRTGEAASSLVQYGKTENLLSATGGQIDSEFDHKVILKGLEPDTKYFFKANSIDWAGNIGVSEVQSFTTKKAPSVIEEIQGTEEQKVKTTEVLKQLEDQIKVQKEGIVDPLQALLDALSPLVPEPIIIGESPEIEVNSTFATIKWRTDKKSTSFVALSREDEFDSASQEPYKLIVGNPDDSVKEHIVEVTNLLPATKYHYQVRSKALLGNTSESKDFIFTTKSELPQIVSFLQKKTENEKTAVIYWETSIPTDSVVKYTPYVKGKINPKDAKLQGKPDMVGDHEITLTNLDPGTIYQVEISGKDPFGNQVSKVLPDFTTAIDKDAPVISQVRIESAMISGKTPKIQTIISYRTDEPATSQVYYAEGGSDKFKQLTPDLNLSTIHTSVVTDFKPASIYRIRIESTDESGNLATSRDFTILTPAQSQSIIDIIIKTFENTFGWVKNIKF